MAGFLVGEKGLHYTAYGSIMVMENDVFVGWLVSWFVGTYYFTIL